MAAVIARISRTNTSLYHVRWSSRGVLERLKTLIGVEKQDAGKQQSEISEPTGLFLHEDVSGRMQKISSRTFRSRLSENWRETPTTDIATKFKLLQECHKEFGDVPPNNLIDQSKCVQDFVSYYETVKRPGIIPEMWKLQHDELPKNLSFESPLPYKPAKTKPKH